MHLVPLTGTLILPIPKVGALAARLSQEADRLEAAYVDPYTSPTYDIQIAKIAAKAQRDAERAAEKAAKEERELVAKLAAKAEAEREAAAKAATAEAAAEAEETPAAA